MFISLTILAERVFFLKRYARLHAIVIPEEQRKVGLGGGGWGGGLEVVFTEGSEGSYIRIKILDVF